MLSRTLGVMFKVKQLFTKNQLLLLLISLFLVHFKSLGVVRSQSLKVSKSYQTNQVTSIKKLRGVLTVFLLLRNNIKRSLKFQRLYYINLKHYPRPKISTHFTAILILRTLFSSATQRPTY